MYSRQITDRKSEITEVPIGMNELPVDSHMYTELCDNTETHTPLLSVLQR